ncbi:anaerobic ribonucleoside-triphosphate reductase [Aliarcobacter cryaerophilus]|uniref:anaerobic ribonucleoside-triphosphate reductase n=1 Tax=Aliarcobacter cryaerophilus TaxID=28198 RepID=UPI003DA5A5B1
MEKIKLLEKNIEKRTKCIVYTRVMGYHRPVESFNIGYRPTKGFFFQQYLN